MSHFTHGQNGVALVDKKQYKDAIEPLSKAIKVTKSPAWLLARAHAYQQTGELERALDDADMAYLSAAARTQAQSKSQMIAAQYRRAVVLFKMKKFADADACCVWSMQLIEGKKFHSGDDDVARNVDEDGDYRATVQDAKDTSAMPKQDPTQADTKNRFAADWTRAFVWRSQALAAMEKLPKGDPGRKITVVRVPQPPKERADLPFADKSAKEGTTKDAAAPPSSERTPGATAAKPAPLADKEKLKVDYYQTNTAVSLTIYVKDTDKQKLDIQVNNGDTVSGCHMHANGDSIPDTDNHTQLLIKGLPNHQVPVTLQLSNHTSGLGPNIAVTKHKIEFSLLKAQPGQKWVGWGSQKQGDSDSPPPKPAFETKVGGAPQPLLQRETTGTLSCKFILTLGRRRMPPGHHQRPSHRSR